MKKMLGLLSMLLMFCVSALAADANSAEVAPDYQALLGGDKAVGYTRLEDVLSW